MVNRHCCCATVLVRLSLRLEDHTRPCFTGPLCTRVTGLVAVRSTVYNGKAIPLRIPLRGVARSAGTPALPHSVHHHGPEPRPAAGCSTPRATHLTSRRTTKGICPTHRRRRRAWPATRGTHPTQSQASTAGPPGPNLLRPLGFRISLRGATQSAGPLQPVHHEQPGAG